MRTFNEDFKSGPIIEVSQLKSRTDLAYLCNVRGLYEAVEVGTDCGDFAFEFLSIWEGRTLVCIDPYMPYGEMNFERTMDMMMAAVRLAPFGWRCKFVRDFSPKAIKHIPAERPIQFVYIDGDHEFESVSKDVNAWWNRLASGGILAGHDFCDATPGVVMAVNGFAFAHNLTIHIINDPIYAPSWYIEKP